MSERPRLGVYKLSSCAGCQRALLGLDETLLALCDLVDIVHWPAAGPLAPGEPVDVAVVEGSVSTAGQVEVVRTVRGQSRHLIAAGACAASGGPQALRNLLGADVWAEGFYPGARDLGGLENATAVSEHVPVDLELWGCPVTSAQLLAALGELLLLEVAPRRLREVLCLECKRRQTVCTLVARGEACMGPLTRAGCGALCPSFGRACYGCNGPSEVVNDGSLARCFTGLGLLPRAVARRFHFINSAAPPYLEAGKRLQGKAP